MTVLCYHKVNERETDWNNITVREETFYEQMKYLAENYDIVKADSSNVNDGQNVAITFDDGYQDFYYRALPILKNLKIPATVFLSTEHIGSECEDWCNELSRLIVLGCEDKDSIIYNDACYSTKTYEERLRANREVFRLMKRQNYVERTHSLKYFQNLSAEEGRVSRQDYYYLTPQQIEDISREELISIGCHTVSHPSLGRLCIDEQKNEILQSKRIIEQITNRQVHMFAYPFGGPNDYTELTMDILQSSGFTKAFTTSTKRISSREEFEIPRICVSECSIEEFKCKVKEKACI